MSPSFRAASTARMYNPDASTSAYTLSACRAAINAWRKANFVGALPSFLWIDPDGRNVPIVGQADALAFGDLYDEAIDVSLTYTALGKGKPVV